MLFLAHINHPTPFLAYIISQMYPIPFIVHGILQMRAHNRADGTKFTDSQIESDLDCVGIHPATMSSSDDSEHIASDSSDEVPRWDLLSDRERTMEMYRLEDDLDAFDNQYLLRDRAVISARALRAIRRIAVDIVS
jgi:hypothetical protein